MHWKFDIDRRSLSQSIDGVFIKNAKLAFPDKYPLKADFYRGEALFQFSGKLKITIKPTNCQTGSALASNEVVVANSSTTSLVLNLATTAMRDFVKDFGERPAALELLVLDNAGIEIASWTVDCGVSRRYTSTGDVAVDLPDFRATRAEAEAGTNNTKWMTPLRTRQALEAVGIEVMGG